jgi:hypothetical protein
MEHYLKGPGGDPPSSEIDYAAYLPDSTDSGGTSEKSSATAAAAVR